MIQKQTIVLTRFDKPLKFSPILLLQNFTVSQGRYTQRDLYYYAEIKEMTYKSVNLKGAVYNELHRVYSTGLKLSYLHSQTSSGFVRGDFLELTPKF